jgi:hypothetical protein
VELRASSPVVLFWEANAFFRCVFVPVLLIYTYNFWVSIFRAILLVCALEQVSLAGCIPFDQAHKHIGETQCVTGRVVRVQAGSGGTHYLDFCEDYRLCSFTVVIFSYDLKNVGDVRQLAGKMVEIRGEVKDYDDRAEIILESRKQLSGEFAMLPPLPKSFDVEQRGHFSAGKFRSKKPYYPQEEGNTDDSCRDFGRCGGGVIRQCTSCSS